MKHLLLSFAFFALVAPTFAQTTPTAPPFMPTEDATTTKLYRAQVLLSIAEVCNLSTAPRTILPPIPGYSIVVEYGAAYRTGARYATNGGNIKLRLLNSDFRIMLENSGGVLTADDTPPVTDFRRNAGVAGFISDWPNSLGNKGLDVWTATNATVDGTNTGSPVWLVVWYRLVPSYVTGL